MIVIEDIEQGTDAWKALRMGIPTASNFKKIITSKGAISSSRLKYLRQKAGERVNGEIRETYKNGFMDKGNEREDESRKIYEFINDVEVKQVAFGFLNENRDVGCSPDGLIGKDGMWENKNAEGDIQIERLEEGWKWKGDHYHQVQGNLWVFDRKWCDLVSYSRNFPQVIIRVKRNEDYIDTLSHEIKKFNIELDALVEKYRTN